VLTDPILFAQKVATATFGNLAKRKFVELETDLRQHASGETVVEEVYAMNRREIGLGFGLGWSFC